MFVKVSAVGMLRGRGKTASENEEDIVSSSILVKTNTEFTYNLFLEAIKAGIDHLTHASSTTIIYQSQ